MSLVRKRFEFDGTTFDCCAIVTPDNKVYWKLSNFSDLLGYFEPYGAYKLIDDKFKFKWSQLSESYPECGNWHPNTVFVSEPGIYSLLFRSRSVFAKKFLYQVIQIVLPAIRETRETPHIATSQANSLIHTLRETLSEKDRLLTETREALTARERTLSEVQMTLRETRGALQEGSRMLEETRAELEEKNRMLENEVQQKRQLQNDVRVLRSRIAITPDSNSVRYVFHVYKHENTYKFIRAQKRCLKKAIKRIPARFELVYSINDTPNPYHIVNRLKELLPRCKVRSNEITTDANVIELLNQCI